MNHHPDTFTHGGELQINTAGHWYFHKAGDNYKGGTYKGLDLTFGPCGVAGGVLLRYMENVSTGQLIEGPCKVVDIILLDNGMASIASLVGQTEFEFCGGIINPYLYMRMTKTLRSERSIFKSPRVGLTLKKPDTLKPSFIMKPLRFTSLAQKITKQKSTIVLALIHEGRSETEIAAISGLTFGRVSKYISSYQANIQDSRELLACTGAEFKTEDRLRLFAFCVKQGFLKDFSCNPDYSFSD